MIENHRYAKDQNKRQEEIAKSRALGKKPEENQADNLFIRYDAMSERDKKLFWNRERKRMSRSIAERENTKSRDPDLKRIEKLFKAAQDDFMKDLIEGKLTTVESTFFFYNDVKTRR